MYTVKRRDSRFLPVLHAICNYRATRGGHDTWPNASLCEFKQDETKKSTRALDFQESLSILLVFESFLYSNGDNIFGIFSHR